MRGYLKYGDSLFILSPKVTTVGSENCALIIQSPDVDVQHAVIDYSETDSCFVLQDLNSAKGTYVNDCRVQNAAVRLASGDSIRFGVLGPCYKFLIDATTQQFLPSNDAASSRLQQSPALPHLRPGCPPVQAWTPTQAVGPVGPNPVVPHPPQSSCRSRPLSAGSRKPNIERYASVPRVQTASPGSARYMNPHGWVTVATDVNQARTMRPDYSPANDLKSRVACIREEIRRLLSPEVDLANKDDIISSLHDEVAALQTQLRLADSRARDLSAHTRESSETVMALDPSIWRTPRQQQQTRMMTSRLQPDDIYTTSHGYSQHNHPSSQPSVSRDPTPPYVGGNRNSDVSISWSELEKLRKDKAAASEIVSQMQREVSAKESAIQSLTNDVERLRTEILSKDKCIAILSSDADKLKSEILTQGAQLSGLVDNVEAMKASVAQKEAELASLKQSNVEFTKKVTSELEVKERERLLQNHKQKTAEARVEELNGVVTSLKEDLVRSRDSDIGQQEINRKLQKELQETKERERSEQVQKNQLEQLSSRLEKLRSQIVQLTFQGSENTGSSQVSDDGLVSTLRIYLFERSDLQKKVKDLETHASENEKMLSGSKKFKQQLTEIISKLNGDEHITCQSLKSVIKSVSELPFAGNEISCSIRDSTVKTLSVLQLWIQRLEAVLQQRNVDIKTDHNCLQAVESHIATLETQLKEASQASNDLQLRYDAAQVQHQVDLNATLNNLRQKLEIAHHSELHKVMQDGELSLKKAVEQSKTSERSTYESIVSSLKQDIEQLRQQSDCLIATVQERESGIDSLKAEAQRLLGEVEMHKCTEQKLGERLEQIEQSKRDTINRLEVELSESKAQLKKENVEREEQLRKHTDTIRALEEQIDKTVTMNKDYQAEIASLKASVADLNERLLQPPKPPMPKLIVQKPVVDVVTLQRTMNELERANADYVQQVQQLNDVITSLRRDLAGSMAKLSDMTGEINENQKLETEKSRLKIRDLEKEVKELRQKATSLSSTVDQLNESIKKQKSEISKNENSMKSYQDKLKESSARIQELESQKSDVKECTHIVDEERTNSELMSMGAQCKGDRHDQVIARQREALVELRTRIRRMEKLVAGSDQTPDQALQQVLLLQSQYGQLEENEMAMSAAANGSDLSHVDRAVNMARGLRSRMDIDMQLGILRDSQLALELSETSYLALLRAMATVLDVGDIQGHQSMAHTPGSEREHLAESRTASSCLLVDRVKALKDLITKRDETLRGYELNMAKLAETQQFAEETSLKTEAVNMEVRKLSEEVLCLRELLARSREELERERRLNEAIKQKKTFYLEHETLHKNGWPRHNCVQCDAFDKIPGKKKVHARGRSVDIKLPPDGLKMGGKSDGQMRFPIASADG